MPSLVSARSPIAVKAEQYWWIRAGVNLFLYRYSDDKTIKIIEDIAKKAEYDKTLQECIEVSYEKIIKLKQKYGLVVV